MTHITPAKILLVEDDMITASDISVQLTKLGYEVIGITTRGEDALETAAKNRPDVILMDIVLSGNLNGIETSQTILDRMQIPVIFLTSNSDDSTFQKAIKTKPYAFVSKPFTKSELERALKLTLQRIAVEQESPPGSEPTDHISSMEDRLFIRHKNQLVKVLLADILYAEANRTYCKVHTDKQDYLLSVPLRNLETQLPSEHFLRIHRSYVVNLRKVDAISENYESVTIDSKRIPIARRNKEEVVKRLKLI